MKAKDRKQFEEAWMAQVFTLAVLFHQAGRGGEEWGDFRKDMAKIIKEAADRSFPEVKAEGTLPEPKALKS